MRSEIDVIESRSPAMYQVRNDEINLRELFAIFWSRRLLVLSAAAAFLLLALILALVLPKKYSATTTLQPVQSHSSGLGGAGSLLSSYMGLAGLVGMSVPGDQRKEEAIALLKSTLIAEKFIQKNNLLPVIYKNRWNERRHTWRPNAHVPTLWEASQFFKQKIAGVSEDTKTGLVKVSITWRNPNIAATWANGLVDLVNDYARKQAIYRARRDIGFLGQQAQKTQFVEERQGIFSIMQGELTKEMLAEGTRQYLLRVLDPAFAPEKPSFPKPLLWSLLGFFVGTAVGCIYALVRHQPGAIVATDTEVKESEKLEAPSRA